MTSKISSLDIAIVGMSIQSASASNLGEYWYNVVHKVDGVINSFDERHQLSMNLKVEEKDGSKTSKDGFLHETIDSKSSSYAQEDFEAEFRFALKLAKDALEDAGYAYRTFNKKKTGFILGTCDSLKQWLKSGAELDVKARTFHQQTEKYFNFNVASSVQEGMNQSYAEFSLPYITQPPAIATPDSVAGACLQASRSHRLSRSRRSRRRRRIGSY